MSDRLGKIAPGMVGNLVITDGDLFAKKTKVLETWVDGRRFELDKPPEIDVRGTWQLELTGADDRVLRAESQDRRHGEAAERHAEQARRGRREGRGDQAGQVSAERVAARAFASRASRSARKGRRGLRRTVSHGRRTAS